MTIYLTVKEATLYAIEVLHFKPNKFLIFEQDDFPQFGIKVVS